MAKTYYVKVVGGVVDKVLVGDGPDTYLATTQHVSTGWTYDGSTFHKPTEVVDLDKARSEVAPLTRGKFCIVMRKLGLLPKDEVVEAAKGSWPPSFQTALDGVLSVKHPDLTADEREEMSIDYQTIWASASYVDRLDPLLVAIAAVSDVNDAQLDEAFGINA